MANKYQRIIYEILGTRPIAFNPILAKITGSIPAGLLLSQLLYWYRKGKDKEWFYKTHVEITKETSLSRGEIDYAVKKLKQLKIIEVKVKGLPAKRYFKINLEHIDNKLSSCRKSCNKLQKIAQPVAENPATIHTDNTTDNTHIFSFTNYDVSKKNRSRKEDDVSEENVSDLNDLREVKDCRGKIIGYSLS